MPRIISNGFLVFLTLCGCAGDAESPLSVGSESQITTDQYPSTALVLRSVVGPDGNLETLPPTNGVIVGDHWVLVAAHTFDQYFDSTPLVIDIFQGDIPNIDALPLVPESRRRSGVRLVPHENYHTLGEGFPGEEVGAPSVDLALIQTGGEPFPKEWQAILSGPIQLVAQPLADGTGIDYAKSVACWVDFVTYQLTSDNLARTTQSACQVHGTLSDPGVLNHFIERRIPYFVHNYHQLREENNALPALDEAGIVQFVRDTTSLFANALVFYPRNSVAVDVNVSATTNSARFCRGNSGSPLYIRGTNYVIGIMSAGGSGDCDQEGTWDRYRYGFSPNLFNQRAFFERTMVGETSPFRPR